MYAEHFRSISFFIGGNVRPAVQTGHADCIPIFLHEIPRVFNEGYIKPDIALIHVTPPDHHGYCSLGTSVDCVRSAVSNSTRIVGKFSNLLKLTRHTRIVLRLILLLRYLQL